MNNLTKDQISYLVHSLSKIDELADVILIDTGAGSIGQCVGICDRKS